MEFTERYLKLFTEIKEELEIEDIDGFNLLWKVYVTCDIDELDAGAKILRKRLKQIVKDTVR